MNTIGNTIDVASEESAATLAEAVVSVQPATKPALELWQIVWRKGVAPQLSVKGLQALAKALANDDPRLITGGTTQPPPLQSMASEPVEWQPFRLYVHNSEGFMINRP